MKNIPTKEYLKRFPTGWSEQVMLACDHFAKECKEADAQNDQATWTLSYGLAELVASLYGHGFDMEKVELCWRDALSNSSFKSVGTKNA